MSTPTEPRAACRKALATSLSSYLTPLHSGIVVSEKWPTPGKALTALSLTVITPGTAPKVEFHQPVKHKVTLPESGHAGTVLYSYGRVDVDLQIDAWALYPATRDALALSTLRALNRPANVTLSTPALTDYSHAPGLVLRLTDWFNVTASYRFDALGAIPENSDAAQVNEYRATWQGSAHFYLCDEQQLYLMQKILLKAKYDNGPQETIQLIP